MIQDVIVDMVPFIIVMLITLCGFADAFLSFSIESDKPFVSDPLDAFVYTYMLIIGEFNTEFGSEHAIGAGILFFLCTIFNLIVMLNLLIAIISNTFQKVQDNNVNTMY